MPNVTGLSEDDLLTLLHASVSVTCIEQVLIYLYRNTKHHRTL